MPAKRCRHCRDPRKLSTRPRGLCWHCYYTPGVRDRYPSQSKFGQRGVASFGYYAAPLPEPTTAAPGSPEKLAVMEQRARRGEQIFHPDDAGHPTRPTTSPVTGLRRGGSITNDMRDEP